MATLNRFLELPITVQNQWESYEQIAEALDQLTIAGNYYTSSLLTQALFTDDRVSSCLNTRTNAIFGLPKTFQYPGQDKPDDDTDEEAIALKEHIRDVVEANWEEILPGDAGREWHRWGIMENLGVCQLGWNWIEGADPKFDPDGIKLPTAQTWSTQFCYWRWDTRSFWINHLGGTAEMHAGDGNWVLLSPFGHNHGWLYGLINSVAWLYMDRIFLKRNWARANEKWSLGVMKGIVPADADAPDKQNFTNAIQNMPHESAVLLPMTKAGNKFDIEMLKTDIATGWQTFLETKRSIDVDIAIDFLGQNLSTEISSGSGGSGGSKAAAKVHNDIREDILKADVEVLQTTIRKQILTPLVAQNWGHLIAEMGLPLKDFVPNVTWEIEPPEDKESDATVLLALSQAVPVLNAAGVDMPALFERFDIPMIDGTAGWDEGKQADMIEKLAPPAKPEPSEDDDGEDKTEKLSRGHLEGSKLKGQLAIDVLTRGLTKELRQQMKPTVSKLHEIVMSSDSYSDRRRKIVELYRDWDPRDVRAILQRALIAANLIGRVSSAGDRAH